VRVSRMDEGRLPSTADLGLADDPEPLVGEPRKEWIDPVDVEVRVASARAALALHDPKAALDEIATARAAHPRETAKLDELEAQARRELKARGGR